MPNILRVGILLAAGKSSRFSAANSARGSQKLLAELPNYGGKRVIEVSAANLLHAVGRVIAVTHRDEKLIRVLDDCGCQVVVNERAHEGMGTSIAAGVNASLDADGWIIALGDMPYVEVETIRVVYEALTTKNQIVVPAYRGRRGHPVGFGRQYGESLRLLHGDVGAKSIVDKAARECPENLLQIDVSDAGLVKDIDVPSDIE